jgi:hypothetical protein
MSKLQVLQNELDEKKWLASQLNNKDMCGCFSYCKHCNKRNLYPCASAYNKEKKLKKEVKANVNK